MTEEIIYVILHVYGKGFTDKKQWKALLLHLAEDEVQDNFDSLIIDAMVDQSKEAMDGVKTPSVAKLFYPNCRLYSAPMFATVIWPHMSTSRLISFSLSAHLSELAKIFFFWGGVAISHVLSTVLHVIKFLMRKENFLEPEDGVVPQKCVVPSILFILYLYQSNKITEKYFRYM